MRKITLLFALFLGSQSFAQQSFNGQVLSLLDSMPIPDIPIHINKIKITTDSNGVFHFQSPAKKIHLTTDQAFYNIDTLIPTKLLKSPITLYTVAAIDSSLAVMDIKKGRIKLFCGGGFAPISVSTKDKEFETKYDVTYSILGCVIPSVDNLISYNKKIAEYLDKTYGTSWRKTVRQDIFL